MQTVLELWKDVIGYEGLYQVSNLGRVKKLYKTSTPDKIMNLSTNIRGYKQLNLTKDGYPKCKKVSRLVAEAFIPNPLNLPEVNHKDGIKSHNYESNLEWCTRQENITHAYSNGLLTNPIGEDSRRSKLKNSDVIQIRSMHQLGEASIKDLSNMFNLSTSNIRLILKRKTWSHI